jgi:hypothetical protein
MLIGADRPENWNRQADEGSNINVAHTKCVNEEVVLDLVHIPRAGSVLQSKSKFS